MSLTPKPFPKQELEQRLNTSQGFLSTVHSRIKQLTLDESFQGLIGKYLEVIQVFLSQSDKTSDKISETIEEIAKKEQEERERQRREDEDNLRKKNNKC